MSYTFERPVGAAADARELEYVAALHQTQDSENDAWMDGSIEATDIKNFLLSRYGVAVTKEEVRNLILADMGGGDSEDECIDLTEVVAILLIPFLAKLHFKENEQTDSDFVSATYDNLQSQFEKEAYMNSLKLRRSRKEGDEILATILKMILLDVTQSSSLSQPLTRELLQRIFSHYGERNLVKDDKFIDEMINAASGGQSDPQLNVETFLRALTHDIHLYDVKNESKFQTHFEDVFGLVTHSEEKEQRHLVTSESEKEKSENDDVEEAILDLSTPTRSPSFSRQFTFPQIDFLADTFRSRSQYICVWLAAVTGYIFWFRIGENSFGVQVCKEENMSKFGCKIGQSIILWIIVMLQMVIVVAPTVMILSLGNNVYKHSLFEIIAGIIGVVVLVILPALLEIKWFFLDTKTIEEAAFFSVTFDVIALCLGVALLLIQGCNIMRFLIPDDQLTKSKAMTSLLRGSSVRSEFGIKQATIFKVHQMVKNALDLHNDDVNSTDDVSTGDGGLVSSATALLNFTKVTEKREPSGGFLWAWKMFLSGKLIEQEGVWLQTKILAGNLAQILLSSGIAVILYILVGLVVIPQIMSDIKADTDPLSHMSPSCIFSFDPQNCYYPETDGNATGVALCPDIIIDDTTCLSKFINASGDIYDTACGIFEDGVKELPPPANYYFDECPQLYLPYPNITFAAAEGSNDESYCLSPMSACSAPIVEDGYISIGACIMGMNYRNLMPFQFIGDLCSNFTELSSTLEGKYEHDLAMEEIASKYLPKEWQLRLSLAIALICIFLVAIANAISTVPSMIITTLKFRSGAISSLRDPYFKTYRRGLLATTFLLGGTIWGAVVSAAVVFTFAFIGTFLSVFQVTRPFVFSFFALLIGITVTLTIKIVVSLFLNKYDFVGFYRKRPFLANLSSLFFECWHLALTLSYIIARVIKLFVIIIVYVGRFDTPVLAQGVGELGPVKLDAFPFIFKQSILAMDAHRHPYLERLGMMYLMKLKHGDKFAQKTGSIWRLLFVFALFPWLRQYRILDEDAIFDSDTSPDETEGLDSKLSNAFQARLAVLNQKIQRLTEMNKILKKE